MARELDALVRIYGKPACIVSDNVLAREQNAVLGVRSRGIRSDRIFGIVAQAAPPSRSGLFHSKYRVGLVAALTVLKTRS